MVFLLFVLGLVIIIKGGNVFIDAAVVLAKKLQISELIIGATIVSLGTTLPEVAASVNAALQGESQFALGNAIGSIDINTGFVLGILIILSNITINKAVFWKKGLFLIAYMLVLIVLSLDNFISRFDGMILLAMMLIYFYMFINEFKNNPIETKVEYEEESTLAIVVFNLLLGAVLVGFGAHLLVDNGIKIADIFAVPPYIVSLTLISFGTSLPELVTSIIALLKKHQGMSVGNIIGANVLNIGFVVSLTAIVNPIEVSNKILYFDYMVALLLIVLSVAFALKYNGYKKYNGFLMLFIYLVYISVTVLGLV
ncbi:calcium/sodium antiporter [Natronospora cellulosivora (SeqCode)]